MTAVPFTAAAEMPTWLVALRRYLVFSAAAHLLWEFAHLPLYTIWQTGTPGELVFAATHCTGGDILITLSTFALALLLFGTSAWPRANGARVLSAALVFGVGYTIFSEWLNIEIRGAWAYRDLMPVIPVIDAGLSPVLQWVAIPIAAYRHALGWRPWRRMRGGPRMADLPLVGVTAARLVSAVSSAPSSSARPPRRRWRPATSPTSPGGSGR